MVRAALGPVPLQHFQLYPSRLGGKQPFRPQLSRRAVEWTLEVQYVTGGGGSFQLLALDSAHFGVFGANREDWGGGIWAEFRYVFGIAIDDSPADTSGDRRLRHLGHPSSNRLYQNPTGPLCGVVE